MKIPSFEYHRPTTVEEATSLLADLGDEAKVLAGGQSLLPLLALRLTKLPHLVDLGRVEGLDHLREDESELVIGCMVRHVTVEFHKETSEVAPLLSLAMPHIGHRAIRNRGTVCGSLAHADPAAELPAVMAAVGASMVVRSRAGERSVRAEDFFSGYLTSDLAPDEILLEVRLPRAGQRSAWSLQEVARRHGDFALIGLAAGLDFDSNGAIEHARLVFFGAGSVPVRIVEAEALLVGEQPSRELFEQVASNVTQHLDPPADLHGSVAYRKHLGAVLTRRCLAEMAAQRAGAA